MRKIASYGSWIGLLLIAAGFCYDVMFAGIPYQDAPESLTEKYNRNSRIAGWIESTGLIMVVTGLLFNVVSRFRQRR